MKGAGGRSRESRDDIGIGSVRRPGERGTATDKVPTCCLSPTTRNTPVASSCHPTSIPNTATLPGFECNIDTHAYSQRPAASIRRQHNASADFTTHPPTTNNECALIHFSRRPGSSSQPRRSLLSPHISGLAANASLRPPWLRPSTTMTSRSP
jgi:hypothetical protein